MKDVLQQLCELSEEGELIETKTNYENLVDQWNQLSDRLTMWIAKLQTELNSVDSLFVEFQATLMKVKDWMAHTERILSSHDDLSADQKRTDQWVDRIKVSYVAWFELHPLGTCFEVMQVCNNPQSVYDSEVRYIPISISLSISTDIWATICEKQPKWQSHQD